MMRMVLIELASMEQDLTSHHPDRGYGNVKTLPENINTVVEKCLISAKEGHDELKSESHKEFNEIKSLPEKTFKIKVVMGFCGIDKTSKKLQDYTHLVFAGDSQGEIKDQSNNKWGTKVFQVFMVALEEAINLCSLSFENVIKNIDIQDQQITYGIGRTEPLDWNQYKLAMDNIAEKECHVFYHIGGLLDTDDKVQKHLEKVKSTCVVITGATTSEDTKAPLMYPADSVIAVGCPVEANAILQGIGSSVDFVCANDILRDTNAPGTSKESVADRKRYDAQDEVWFAAARTAAVATVILYLAKFVHGLPDYLFDILCRTQVMCGVLKEMCYADRHTYDESNLTKAKLDILSDLFRIRHGHGFLNPTKFFRNPEELMRIIMIQTAPENQNKYWAGKNV